MSRAHQENRREVGRDLRFLGLLVALYAAVWLVLAYRAGRMVATECTVVQRPYDRGSCALEHVVDGEREQTPWDHCKRGVWEGRPVGTRLRCFYYASEPSRVLLGPRHHAWATPVPVAILAGGLLLVLVAQLRFLCRPRTPPAAVVTPASPYRRAGKAPKAATLAPLHLEPLRYGCWRWVAGAPFLLLGVIIVVLSFGIQWFSGGGVNDFFVLASSMGHGAVLLGAAAALLRAGIDVLPDEGLLVRWWAIGPLRLRRFVDLAEVTGATMTQEGFGRGATTCLAIERRGLRPLRSSWGTPDDQRAQAEAINAIVRHMN
jgi:hypothetical protein